MMRQRILTMLLMQDKMNQKVASDWIEQGFEWYRAVWLECGELIEHQGYKWWKKQQTDVEQVRLEVVDIWHFGMSMLFDGRDVPAIAAQIEQDIPQSKHDLGVHAATEELALDVLGTRKFSIAKFWALLDAVNMSFEELYTAYIGKNVLNFFRQDNGYQEGSYRKLWDGREDNEHLVEIIAAFKTTEPSFAEDLYAALEQRYLACA